MSLKKLDLKFKYRSSLDVIHEDFYLPCLKNSHKYDRAVGYFTSNSLSLLSEGLEEFLTNDGKIRIIANPHLTPKDLEAIELGYKAREDVITESLLRELEVENSSSNLTTLSLLIYRKQLDIKIAFPETSGIYHEKFGVFTDFKNNSVAFSGSANETVGGLKDNFEKIDVYFNENDQIRIEDMKKDFEDLWGNNTPELRVIPMPDIVIRKLQETVNLDDVFISQKQDTKIKPRNYQKEAMDSIINNDWHGILDMATGTGKTFTSLLIANEFFMIHKKIFLLIIVPYQHLIDQWIDNMNVIGFKNPLICSSNNRNWRNELHSKTRDFNNGFIDKQVVITTYNTAASKDLNEYMAIIRGYDFLIADECHYFGQPRMLNNKLASFQAKIGLSATPERWFDAGGSSYINSFFKGTVFNYSLEKAISNGFLTEYQYKPIITDLTENEVEEYENLTRKIVPLMSNENRSKNQNDLLKRLLIKRSRIVKGAELKTEMLINILSKENVETTSHLLVYCAEGKIDYITQKINRLGYRVHRFDHRVPNHQRKIVLDAFEQGTIQILVAINCLDEGVDVPATKTAYFLSSTSNPRQFVQRRGRVLRKSKNKTKAEIYDFITIPSNAKDGTFESIVKKEIPRIWEFTDNAINKYKSRNKIQSYLEKQSINLSYLLDSPDTEELADYTTEEE